MKTINVLGSEYNVHERTPADDPALNDCDGYCDKTSHKIVVIAAPSDNSDIDFFEVYKKKVIRHEIIHAFLFESGPGENWEHKGFGHEETVVDWIAIQFPKILAAFVEADAL